MNLIVPPCHCNLLFSLEFSYIIAKAGEGDKLYSIAFSCHWSVTLSRGLYWQLSWTARGFYGLNHVFKHFVTNEDGVSLGRLMALIQDKVFIDSWYILLYFAKFPLVLVCFYLVYHYLFFTNLGPWVNHSTSLIVWVLELLETVVLSFPSHHGNLIQNNEQPWKN